MFERTGWIMHNMHADYKPCFIYFFLHALISTQIQDKQKWIFFFFTSVRLWALENTRLWSEYLTCFYFMLPVCAVGSDYKSNGKNTKPTRMIEQKKRSSTESRKSRNRTVNMAATMNSNSLCVSWTLCSAVNHEGQMLKLVCWGLQSHI